jgi:hypothetical protein
VEVVLEALAKAHGFVDTADQEVFDTCEEAVSEVVRTIRSVSAQWKVRTTVLIEYEKGLTYCIKPPAL